MLNPVAENVLRTRYLQKDKDGNPIETIDQMWRRVAKHASKAEPNQVECEKWFSTIYDMLSKQIFLFNSPTLVNAGTSINGLSACFVVGMDDSVEGIWKAKQDFAKIAQKGGGCGVNVDNLRPKGDTVAGSTHAKAGGPIAFLETIWHDMEAMTQSGFRAMACMAIMRVDHPDIIDFIEAKSPANALAKQLNCSVAESKKLWDEIKAANTLTEYQQRLVKLSERYLSNFNISIGITNEFIDAVKNDSMFKLHFGGKIYYDVRARDIWDKIIHSAWASGDPGLFFLDTVNNNSPYRYSGQVIKASNPCGEQPLPPNGVCNLGSIDVSKFIRDGVFLWADYAEACRNATHALNNIVEIADWPTKDIEKWVYENRPIGLGVMGYADALLLLGMKYGSEDALEFAKNLISVMYTDSHIESVKLGNERGIPKACKSLPIPRRNSTLLTIAPTGTISLIAGCSSGCEPVFQYVQTRQDNTGTYLIIHPAIKQIANVDDIVFPVGTDLSIVNKRAEDILHYASKLSDIFVDANNISLEDHIKTQAAFQTGFDNEACVDSGVSKTVNLPNNATIEDVSKAYMLAFDLQCKGITIYRDGSKFFQILNRVEKEKTAIIKDNAELISDVKDYAVVDAKRYKVKYRGDTWYVIVGLDEDKPMEVFTMTSKEDDTLPTTDALSRIISLALRYGVPVEKVISQLRKVRQYNITTYPAIIARVLSNHLPNDTDSKELVCQSCGSNNIKFAGGCPTCQDCGYSKCS
jgi:ribonucleoside-diphosphate reductase alpha chain